LKISNEWRFEFEKDVRLIFVMKFYFLLVALLFVFLNANLVAQSRDITIILLRHAEKDTSAGADRRDPNLTEAGRARAERLVKVVKKYQPDLVYSTFYKRAKQTAAPVAETLYDEYRLPVRQYNFDELEKFADELLNSNARAIVVVGHNTTTPELANLLIKQEKYEHHKIWIIKIKRNKTKPNRIREKVIRY
jgi:phosphohistidine phosphatase SixA